ncbi:hypothetical protein AWB76_07727 [Caballeronia temeraria]|uniref:Uncharacterized protein n=1 Tax=Caballeronia temeraria TaxID=1777137 RepID=A0A158DXZ6_9BURK|nr:hypothetical protein AWB76_07727 [Caballeronia temeraria]
MLPVDQWIAKAEYRLHWVTKDASGKCLRDGTHDGVLRGVAVLILVDQQTRIRGRYGVGDVTGAQEPLHGTSDNRVVGVRVGQFENARVEARAERKLHC